MSRRRREGTTTTTLMDGHHATAAAHARRSGFVGFVATTCAAMPCVRLVVESSLLCTWPWCRQWEANKRRFFNLSGHSARLDEKRWVRRVKIWVRASSKSGGCGRLWSETLVMPDQTNAACALADPWSWQFSRAGRPASSCRGSVSPKSGWGRSFSLGRGQPHVESSWLVPESWGTKSVQPYFLRCSARLRCRNF